MKLKPGIKEPSFPSNDSSPRIFKFWGPGSNFLVRGSLIKAQSKINLAVAKFKIVASFTHTLPFSFMNPVIQLFIFIWAIISIPIAMVISG